MTTTTRGFQSDFARRIFRQGEVTGREKGRAVGKAEGEADAVVIIFESRGIDVSDTTVSDGERDPEAV
jgi:hypothetical protein